MEARVFPKAHILYLLHLRLISTLLQSHKMRRNCVKESHQRSA
jgi:hypothetical protein